MGHLLQVGSGDAASETQGGSQSLEHISGPAHGSFWGVLVIKDSGRAASRGQRVVCHQHSHGTCQSRYKAWPLGFTPDQAVSSQAFLVMPGQGSSHKGPEGRAQESHCWPHTCSPVHLLVHLVHSLTHLHSLVQSFTNAHAHSLNSLP